MAGTVGEQAAAGRPDCSAHRERVHFPTKFKTPGASLFLYFGARRGSKMSTPRLRGSFGLAGLVLRYVRAGPQPCSHWG